MTVREKPKGSGVWWVFIHHQGRRKAKKVGSKAAARKAAARIEAELAMKGLGLETTRAPTFRDVAKDWLEVTVPATCKESTAWDYENILKNHVGPAFDSRPVDQITRLEVKDFLLGKIRDGYSPSTVNHLKAVISGILNRAVEAEIIEHNPAKSLGRLWREKPRGQEINPFTWDELDKLLATFARHWPRFYPLALCLARTGLRFGEAVALTWDDVDLVGRVIHVRRSFSRGRFVTPKSGKTRKVDMSLQLTETLRELRARRMREYLARGEGGKVPSLVFPSRAGTPLDINHWRARWWRKALVKAELPYHRIHDLRHTYATLRIAKGDSIADVSGQLGHYSIKFTLDQYYHWVPGGAKGEVDGLDSPQPHATYAQPESGKGSRHEA